MNSYKWGVIGPGNIAHNFAEDIKLVNPPQTLDAVFSDHEKSANEFADKFHIAKRFTSLDDFINNSGADVAYIATPHALHYEQTKACLQNKIAVLCEKPIVLNHEQLDELIKLAAANKTFLMEAMWVRFLPSFTNLLTLINKNIIGQITRVKASMAFKAPHDDNNRFYDPEKGGGSLLDLGVYCIFLSTLLAGKPSVIKAIGKLSDKKIDEACGVLLTYNNHAYAILESSLLMNQNQPAQINGTKGVIRILDKWFEKSKGIEVDLDDGNKMNIPLDWKGHGLQFEIEEVINCLSGKRIESDLMPHELSRSVLSTMDEIRNQMGVFYGQQE